MGCKKVGVFIDNEWVSKSYFAILPKLRAAGILPLLITTNKDWDNGLRESIPTEKNEPIYHLQTDLSVTDVSLDDFDGFIFGGGYWVDRLRWWFKKTKPDGRLERPESKSLVEAVLSSQRHKIGVICHSMWILCSIQGIHKGKGVTCAYNIIDDVRNAGFNYIDSDVHVDGNLISGRMSDNSSIFIDEYIRQLTGGGK